MSLYKYFPLNLFNSYISVVKVMGSLAMEAPVPGAQLQGVLVKRNFNYHILAPSDLNSESLATSRADNRQNAVGGLDLY